LSPVPVELDPGDLALPYRPHRRTDELCFGAGPSGPCVITGEHDHAITARVDHVLDSRVVALPRLQPIHKPCPETVEAEVCSAPDILPHEHTFEVRGEEG